MIHYDKENYWFKDMLSPFLSGLGTSLGLIVAIGSQNAYVLKQGLLGNHPFIIAIICSIIDSVMIMLGISGLGLVITSSPILMDLTKYGGAAFLIVYGLKSMQSVFNNEVINLDTSKRKSSLKNTVYTLLALSLLNPHLYLDTCVLIGTIGAQFEGMERKCFALGAISASFIWFFALSYGAKFLAPLFAKPIAWKILDFTIALIMWTIAGFLILGM